MSKYLKQSELIPGSVYMDDHQNQYLYIGQLQVYDTITETNHHSQKNYILPPMYLRVTKKSLKIIQQENTLTDCLLSFIRQNNTFDFHHGLNITAFKPFLMCKEIIYSSPDNIINKATIQFSKDNKNRTFIFTQI